MPAVASGTPQHPGRAVLAEARLSYSRIFSLINKNMRKGATFFMSFWLGQSVFRSSWRSNLESSWAGLALVFIFIFCFGRTIQENSSPFSPRAFFLFPKPILAFTSKALSSVTFPLELEIKCSP